MALLHSFQGNLACSFFASVELFVLVDSASNYTKTASCRSTSASKHPLLQCTQLTTWKMVYPILWSCYLSTCIPLISLAVAYQVKSTKTVATNILSLILRITSNANAKQETYGRLLYYLCDW